MSVQDYWKNHRGTSQDTGNTRLKQLYVKLRFIKKAKQLGFSLKEIEELIALRHKQDATCGAIKAQAEQKIKNIEERIRDLTKMKEELLELTRQCSDNGPVHECSILTALNRQEKIHENYCPIFRNTSWNHRGFIAASGLTRLSGRSRSLRQACAWRIYHR